MSAFSSSLGRCVVGASCGVATTAMSCAFAQVAAGSGYQIIVLDSSGTQLRAEAKALGVRVVHSIDGSDTKVMPFWDGFTDECGVLNIPTLRSADGDSMDFRGVLLSAGQCAALLLSSYELESESATQPLTVLMAPEARLQVRWSALLAPESDAKVRIWAQFRDYSHKFAALPADATIVWDGVRHADMVTFFGLPGDATVALECTIGGVTRWVYEIPPLCTDATSFCDLDTVVWTQLSIRGDIHQSSAGGRLVAVPASGPPLREVYELLLPWWPRTQLGESGEGTFAGVPAGMWRVRDGIYPGLDNSSDVVREAIVNVSGSTAEPASLSEQIELTVRGVVRVPAGLPAVGAVVRLQHFPTMSIDRVTTNSNGEYSITCLDNQDARIWAEREDGGGRSLPWQLRSMASVQLSLRDGARVGGSVAVRESKFVAELKPEDCLVILKEVGSHETTLPARVTDVAVDGTFEFCGVNEGEYLLSATGPNYMCGSRRIRMRSEGTVVASEVDMSPGAFLYVTWREPRHQNGIVEILNGDFWDSASVFANMPSVLTVPPGECSIRWRCCSCVDKSCRGAMLVGLARFETRTIELR